jgi:Lrp/AsnC family transcriptional regulator for asnA, asnC and gidA
MDKIDYQIIKTLIADGRASFSSISKEANLTDVAIKKRLDSLKRRGIISGISVELNYKTLGYENPIFIQIRTDITKSREIIKKLTESDFVLELYQTLGEYNLMAKIITPSLEAAEGILKEMGSIEGIMDLKSLVVLSEQKKTKMVPPNALQKKI